MGECTEEGEGSFPGATGLSKFLAGGSGISPFHPLQKTFLSATKGWKIIMPPFG